MVRRGLCERTDLRHDGQAAWPVHHRECQPQPEGAAQKEEHFGSSRKPARLKISDNLENAGQFHSSNRAADLHEEFTMIFHPLFSFEDSTSGI